MPKEDNLQFELFSHASASGKLKPASSASSFFTRMRHYEKTILIIFSLAVTGIISFSLGVERGKKLVMLPDIARAVPGPVIPQDIAPAVSAPVNLPKQIEEPKPKETTGSYTIQLASYRKKTHAQKEAKTLKKQGLTPMVLSKGNYIVLYVGPFPNRLKAQTVLSQLKKQYQDCRLRRL